MNARVRHALAPLVGALGLFALWEGLVRLFDVPTYQLIRPSRALRSLVTDRSFFWEQAKPTIREALTGLLLALVIALAVGALAAESVFVERALSPLITLLQVTPIVVWAPTLLVFVGIGFRTIVIVVAIVCLAPLLAATITGLRSVDQASLDVFRSVRAPRWQILWRLRLPAALPQLFSALRVGVGLSLIGAVIGEWSALVTKGLGVRLRGWNDLVFRDRFWGVVMSLVLIGVIGVGLVRLVETAVLRGRPPGR
jgi:NitT/TauT family transport system permease protein